MKKLFHLNKKAIILSAFFASLLLLLKAIPGFAESLPIADSQYSPVAVVPDESGQVLLVELVLSGFKYVKVIVVVIGILMITIQGFRMVMASGDEDDLSNAKKSLVYIIIAFILISMGEQIAKLFDMSGGTILESPDQILERVHIFDRQVEIAITFIKYFVGGYATIMLVIAGLSMVTSGSEEEDTTNAKNRIIYSIIGLLIITVADTAINKIFYKVNKEVYSGITGVTPGMDVEKGVSELIGVTNFMVSIMGAIAVLMLIISAVMYASSMGNDDRKEQAQRIITATIVGMLIVFGSFALVSSIIYGQIGITN